MPRKRLLLPIVLGGKPSKWKYPHHSSASWQVPIRMSCFKTMLLWQQYPWRQSSLPYLHCEYGHRGILPWLSQTRWGSRFTIASFPSIFFFFCNLTSSRKETDSHVTAPLLNKSNNPDNAQIDKKQTQKNLKKSITLQNFISDFGPWNINQKNGAVVVNHQRTNLKEYEWNGRVRWIHQYL